jgi:hypothetical protein
MRATSIPGPVRVALGADAGIAAIYALATLVGVPGGRFGSTLVAAEAAVWAGVMLTWVFRPFWSRWSSAVERLFAVGDPDADPGEAGMAALAVLPSSRSLVAGGALFTALAVVQVLTTTGAGIAFRSVVAAYVVAGAVGAAALAVVSDVASLLAAARTND